MTIPFSSFASLEARQAFLKKLGQHSPSVKGGHDQDVSRIRAQTIVALTPLLDSAMQRYPVSIEAKTIAGVETDIVTPKSGVPDGNKDRVLINLHGGGFFVGAHIVGKLESVPIAGLGKFKVITVDYREGPEYKFPAASEDVASVYKALLRQYKPKNIGIYGCSSGGFLTAEVIAWLQKEKLPMPGAIGIFCASAGGWLGGDSSYIATALVGANQPSEAGHGAVSNAAYFSNADMKDPLMAPLRSPDMLAKFPPTLVLTGTRDFAMSSAVFTHGQLVKQDVDAELHVWDGMDHGFFIDCTLPESREAYSVIVKFFDRHLGR